MMIKEKGHEALFVYSDIEVKHIAAAGIDNQCFSPLTLSFEIKTVALMNVPMRHDARAVFVDQVQEGMFQILCVQGRCHRPVRAQAHG